MNVTFYNNQSNRNVLNKKITSVRSAVNCSLKDNTDIKNPTILISKSTISDPTTFNYMYIDGLKRYYYCHPAVEMIGGMWAVTGDIDVLMSHANAIKQLTALVERQENFYNLYLPQLQIPNVAYKRVQTMAFPIQPLDTTGHLILAVSGRG